MNRETKRSGEMRRIGANRALVVFALFVLCCSSVPAPGGGGDGGGGAGGTTSTGAAQNGGGTGGDVIVDGVGGDAVVDGSRPPPGPPPVVTLYPDCEFMGASATLTVGDYDASQLTEMGFATGDVSALRVTPGYKAILYTAPGFLGETVTLTDSSACLTDFSIASLRVRENLGGTGSGTGGSGGTDPGPEPCTSATPSEETCEAFGVLSAGKYWMNNNLWGQDAGSGTQCLRRTCLGGDDIAFETDWSWTGSAGAVKSYASAVLGWHWGYHVEETGLPVQLSSGGSVDCGLSYTVSQNGTMNVAYDLWLHSVPDPQWGRPGVATDQPTDELMIWLYKAGGAAPIGTVQGSAVPLGGALWNVYKGAVTSNGQTLWNVYSFVRTTNTNSATLDLTEFTDHVVSRGWMPSSRYLTSVQLGPEVFLGSGTLTVSSFGCTTP